MFGKKAIISPLTRNLANVTIAIGFGSLFSLFTANRQLFHGKHESNETSNFKNSTLFFN
jgi:hypothetical protein